MGSKWRGFAVEPWHMELPIWKDKRVEVVPFPFIPPHLLAHAFWQKSPASFQEVVHAVDGE